MKCAYKQRKGKFQELAAVYTIVLTRALFSIQFSIYKLLSHRISGSSPTPAR
jgi:hypothetical protein